MGYRIPSVMVIVLAAFVCAITGAAGHATTLQATDVPLEQEMPGRTYCHWSVSSGGLFARGSDAFDDLCHCDAFCAAYAQRADITGKALRARLLPRMEGHWGRRRGVFAQSVFRFPPTSFRQGILWAPCNGNCWQRTTRRGSARVVRVRAPVQPVPLPPALGMLVLGLSVSLLGLRRRRALGVARQTRAAVRPT